MTSHGQLTVTVIEDNADDLALVRRVLQDVDGLNVRLKEANRLSEGLSLIDEFTDVVLLDLGLPDSEGLETLSAVRQRHPNAAIVVMTGLDDSELGARAIQLGANDYLPKEQFRSHVLTRSLLLAIERKRVESAGQEMELATRILRRLYPPGTLSIPGLSIAGACYPAGTAAGDYFDFIPLRDGSLAVAVADVSGHGIGPAVLMTQTRAFLHGMAHFTSDISEMVGHLNVMLQRDTTAEQFVTMFCLQLDPRQRRFRYIGAGHNAHRLTAAGDFEILESTAPILGLEEHNRFSASTSMSLEPGELIFMMTDGIAEMRSADDRTFGAHRAMEFVRGCSEQKANEIVTGLYREARDFARGEPQYDDVAIVVIKSL